MILFACDSSGRAASAAIFCDGKLLCERFLDAGLTHSETLLPLCDEVFKESGLTPMDVDYFAVTTGPGSFTGLRIGVGTVKGMAFAANKQCIAVPTLEAYAYSRPDFNGTIVPVCDARRERVYCAAFDIQNSKVTRAINDCVVPIDELFGLLNGKRNILFIGDAAELCYNTFEKTGPTDFDKVLINASWVAAAALTRMAHGETVTADELRPNYLQLSQAERELNARQKQENGETEQ